MHDRVETRQKTELTHHGNTGSILTRALTKLRLYGEYFVNIVMLVNCKKDLRQAFELLHLRESAFLVQLVLSWWCHS